jgi:hypothetical protein
VRTLTGGSLAAFLMTPAIGALGDRVYPHRLPRDATLPALTYSRVDTVRPRSHSGPSGLPTPRIQLDVWANDPDSADAIAEALRIRLDGYRGQMGDVPVGSVELVGDSDADDAETGLYRRILDVAITHEEAVA